MAQMEMNINSVLPKSMEGFVQKQRINSKPNVVIGMAK
jgi:hypothetical protein